MLWAALECPGLLRDYSGVLWAALKRHAPGVLAAPGAAAAAAATATAGATAPLDFPRISKRISFNSLQIMRGKPARFSCKPVAIKIVVFQIICQKLCV